MPVRLTCKTVFCVLLVSISCQAQQSTLTVDAVLARVREHITEYKTAVPNFISDESVLSQRLSGDKVKAETKVESSFEVVRNLTDGHMRETRFKKLVNGSVPKNQNVFMPYTFNGGVTEIISFLENKCNDHSFAEPPSKEGSIVIATTIKTATSLPSGCMRSTNIKTSKAFIDSQTFQIARVEVVAEDLNYGSHLPFMPLPSNHNTLAISVDYAPVELAGKMYWLARTVTVDVKDKKKPIRFHYVAGYSNYHKYASTVKILSSEPGMELAAAVVPIAPAIATTASTPAGASEKAYAFEVVSMHQNKTTTHESLRQFGPTPDGYHVHNMSLRTILITAFAPQIGGGAFYTSDQIKGIPDWADSVHYDIEARISDADRAEWQNPERQRAMLRAMIQSMLAERCKLVVHREVSVTKVYSLELAKGGPKFKESTPDEVFPPGIKMPWGGVVVPTGDGMRMYGTTMASFATVLAERTDSRRVIQDKTGLTGKYDITLKAEAPLNPAPDKSSSGSESDWDAAMLAAVDSLGLKLVSTKAPVEMLIVDHLDRPSEN